MMKMFTDRKYAAITAAMLYVAAFAVVLSCGRTDGIVTAFLKEGGYFNPSINYSSFKDKRDGKTYKTVKINGRTWMAENLNYTISDSWCYENKNALCSVYGRVYTWEAAKNACASMGDGWKLPTREDWDDLVTYAGGVSTAGKKLKSKIGWSINGNGTDDFGFSALPGVYRISRAGSNSRNYAGDDGYWWGATEYETSRADYRYVYSCCDYVGDGNSNSWGSNKRDKSDGLSVRCLKD